MPTFTSKLRVERDGRTIRVYRTGHDSHDSSFTDQESPLYIGYLRLINDEAGTDGSFGDRHHHGAITHSHPHEGPHFHQETPMAVREVFLSLDRDIEGMDQDTVKDLRLAAMYHFLKIGSDKAEAQERDAAALRKTLVANLKASGFPTHWYVVSPDRSVVRSGPFVSADEALAERAALGANDCRVFEGYIVNDEFVGV
jgi:hypothetical protein